MSHKIYIISQEKFQLEPIYNKSLSHTSELEGVLFLVKTGLNSGKFCLSRVEKGLEDISPVHTTFLCINYYV